jgi:threonine dehydratase
VVTLDDVRDAATRLRNVALRTPLLAWREGAYVKPECLQPTGSFKIRGAFNTLAQLGDERRRHGVVAHSSGNHGQAVARAARLLGMRAVIVMPNDAPQVKVDGVRADGAEIVFVGQHNAERVARAHEIAHDEGLTLVSSANDERVICGQGTIGLEIVEQLRELGDDRPPVVLVPVGLGGLSAGVATAVKALRPDASVFGVEPELAADAHASLAARERIPWPAEQTARTMADGLRGEVLAEIPFEHLLRWLDGVLLVSERDIADAVRLAARELHLVLEPSGAVSLAALSVHGHELPTGAPVCVLSGGNVDVDRFVTCLRPD